MNKSPAQVFVAVFLVVSLGVSAIVALQPGRGLLDFGAFYMAGVALEHDLDPYGVYSELAAETGENFGHTDGRGHSPNLNPPISLYPARLLADIDPEDAKLGLNVASAFVFSGCALFMLRAYPEHRTVMGLLWIASFGGFWYTLWLGQVYVLLFALGLGAWLLIQRGTHPVVAGVLIGLLVAVKPHFAVWPLFLLLAGHPRIAVSSVCTAAAVSAIPLVLEGPEVYRQWLDAAAAYPRLALGSNASLVGGAERIGVPIAGYVASFAVVALSAWVVWASKVSALRASAWGIVVALIASPIAWIGYGLLAMPVLLSRRWEALEWAVALSMTGLWFIVGRGEPFLGASLALLYLLARDLAAKRDFTRNLEAVRSGESQPEHLAA